MKSFLTRTVILAVCLLAFVCAARAQSVAYNNLNATTYDIDMLSIDSPEAASFSTPALGFTLTDVKLLLSGPIPDPPSGAIDVYLLNDASTSPGSEIEAIGTLSDTSLGSSPEVFDFPVSPLVLSPGTRYWIDVEEDPTYGSVGAWAYASSPVGVGVAGEYYSTQGGFVTLNGIDSAGPYQMEVVGTPEPATAGLLILGLGTLGFLGTFRRKVLS